MHANDCLHLLAAAVVLLYSAISGMDTTALGLGPAQRLLMLMLGASCSFITPIGYQTNMMVLRPGEYRFGHFAALGSLLTVLVGLMVAVLAWYRPGDLLAHVNVGFAEDRHGGQTQRPASGCTCSNHSKP